jgi:L,D-transpeptidase ErfK/SrfK
MTSEKNSIRKNAMRWFYLILAAFLVSCQQKSNVQTSTVSSDSLSHSDSAIISKTTPLYFKVPENIKIKDFFPFMDNLVAKVDTFPDYHLNEYLIVHANQWLLDSLMNTDYSIQKKKGKFLYNQPEYIILHEGDSLLIPDLHFADSAEKRLNTTILDVNIPEFKLRIIQGMDTLRTCKIRVGRNSERFLSLADRVVDLRTPIGEGEIIRISRIPYYVDPETGLRYDSTRRDDRRYTKLPIIPWLEPSINDIRYGTLIHPTTNPATLGKAISHGCVGTSEADGWYIYYHAPIHTRVNFRYDLSVVNEQGDSIQLRDIYQHKAKKKKIS